MKISTKKLIYHCLYMALIICSMVFLSHLSDFRSASIAGTIISALVLAMNIGYSKKLLTPANIILVCFILFQFGLPILYAIDPGYKNWYLQQMSPNSLTKNAVFSIICIESFSYGLLLFNKGKETTSNNRGCLSDSNKETILRFARILLVLTGLVAIPLSVYVTYLSFLHGYNYVKVDSMNIYNGLTRFSQEFFVAANILCIVFSETDRNKKIYMIIAAVYAAIVLLSGARTISLAILLVLLFVKSEEGIKHKSKNFVAVLLGIVIIAFAGSAIAEQRLVGNVNKTTITERAESVIEEMGFNFTTINFVESFVPSSKDYQFGKTYIESVASLYPKTLDPTGTIEKIHERNPEIELADWLSKKYGKLYHFGVGYSVIAESYYNFGYLGFVCIFIQGVIIGKLMSIKNDSKFRKYVTYVMLFALLTYPRRSFLTLLKSIEYYIVFIIAGIYILSNKARKNAMEEKK